MTASAVSPAGGMPGPAGLVAATGQLAAATVLVELLSSGLPVATWDLSAITPGRLAGHLHDGELGDRLAGLAVYAGLLGVPADLRRCTEPRTGGHLSLRARWCGVEVEMWLTLTGADLAVLDGGGHAALLGRRSTCATCGAGVCALGVELPSRAARCPGCGQAAAA